MAEAETGAEKRRTSLAVPTAIRRKSPSGKPTRDVTWGGRGEYAVGNYGVA